jgi:hypothetical protein
MFVLMREMVGVYRKQHRDTFDKNSLRYSISKPYINIYLLYKLGSCGASCRYLTRYPQETFSISVQDIF